MRTRRGWMGLSFVAAWLAWPALGPGLRALPRPGDELVQRAIPSSGELLPVIGYGPRPTDGAAIRAVLETLVDHGGKVVDVLHGGPEGEQGARAAAAELRLQDQLFWTTPLAVELPLLPGYDGPPLKADPAAVRAAMEGKFAAFGVSKIDLVMVSAGCDVPTHLAVLRELKQEGRVRYIGVHDLAPPPFVKNVPFYAELESIMRSEPIDFIGVDYSVGDRRVEARILPLAQEKKIGVLAYFPFDRNRIFKRASDTPLPEWAAEFDATTWAQFFLKYVVSHPAVTVVRTGTTQAEHMLDNIGGGIGRLPDEAMRQRMAELVDALPPTPPPGPPKPPPAPPGLQATPVVLSAAVLNRYVGEYRYVAAGQVVTFRRDGDKLLAKVTGSFPEGPLVARSETSFAAPWGATIEFELDGQGQVTGATVQQGPYRIPLERR